MLCDFMEMLGQRRSTVVFLMLRWPNIKNNVGHMSGYMLAQCFYTTAKILWSYYGIMLSASSSSASSASVDRLVSAR